VNSLSAVDQWDLSAEWYTRAALLHRPPPEIRLSSELGNTLEQVPSILWSPSPHPNTVVLDVLLDGTAQPLEFLAVLPPWPDSRIRDRRFDAGDTVWVERPEDFAVYERTISQRPHYKGTVTRVFASENLLYNDTFETISLSDILYNVYIEDFGKEIIRVVHADMHSLDDEESVLRNMDSPVIRGFCSAANSPPHKCFEVLSTSLGIARIEATGDVLALYSPIKFNKGGTWDHDQELTTCVCRIIL
jgi:hypothetical protein